MELQAGSTYTIKYPNGTSQTLHIEAITIIKVLDQWVSKVTYSKPLETFGKRTLSVDTFTYYYIEGSESIEIIE